MVFFVLEDFNNLQEVIMKTNLVIQYSGMEDITKDEIISTIKKNCGKKASEIKSLNVYYQPQSRTAYYTVNGEEKEYVF